MKPVVVAAKALLANQTIEQKDIKLVQMDISDLRRGYLQSKSLVVGQQLRYSISMGRVISPAVLKQQDIVRRGEQVILLATAGTMEVRMKGTAMSDASLGEAVRVKNNSSQRVVEGVVKRSGVVQVAM
jgi:flagella basal body P-ring formation protein FlgA